MATEATIRTPKEIGELKMQWIADGCWDIEDTEGFEAHYEELRAWRLQVVAEHEANERRRVQARANHLGIHVELMMYLEGLERQVKLLNNKLSRYTDLF